MKKRSLYLDSTQRVPYEGPKDSKILVVGEAPGGEEVGQGRPFVGVAGQLLDRYMGRVGINRQDTRLANLCQYRPRDNKFARLLNTPELDEGLEALEQEIKEGEYNLILALGGWPLYFLTGNCGTKNEKKVPGSGIGLYRGSRLPALPKFGGVKVLSTYHPSFILRAWGYNPLLHLDCSFASEDMTFPELRYPEYEEWIDPPVEKLIDIVDESLKSEYVSLDIETFPGGRFSCVGWTYKYQGVYKGVCVTYKSPFLWKFAKEVWEHPVRKTLQYATYDGPFMERFYDWKLRGFYGGMGWDTYIAAANLLPDFPRGLDFLVSINTRLPFYKEERKIWKEKGDMNILWKYNIKDTVGTHLIMEKQQKDIKELYHG